MNRRVVVSHLSRATIRFPFTRQAQALLAELGHSQVKAGRSEIELVQTICKSRNRIVPGCPATHCKQRGAPRPAAPHFQAKADDRDHFRCGEGHHPSCDVRAIDVGRKLNVTHLDQHRGQVLGSPSLSRVLAWLSAIRLRGLTAVGEFLQYRTKAQAAASGQGGTEHFGSVCDKSPRKPTANLAPE